jgi:putative ABC transport system permease protein
VIPLLVVAGLLLAVVVHDALRRPTFRRLAVRNILRRRNESLLVVAGSLLGTAIITASFVVGDTVEASERDVARTKLGEVDVIVSDPARPERLLELVGALDPGTLPGVDGAVAVVQTPATAATVGDDRVAEPYAGLVELDFDAGRAFGSDPGATGLEGAGATPAGDEVVIGADLRDSLDVEVGDEIEVFAYGQSRRLVVRDVVPRVGLAGFGSSAERSLAPVAFVPPGTIDGLLAAAGEAASAATRPNAMYLLSAEGGVFAAEHDRTLEDTVSARLEGVEGADVRGTKREVLANARAEGESIGQLFTGMGGFSVIAGILLLVNIFVMLAEERKTELGVLRALGLKRAHLVRTFGFEGALYAVVAAVLGAGLGVAVGRLISLIANRLINSGPFPGTLETRFTVDPASVATGMLIGLLISMLTVWGTSLRIGRLNVIRAIRDLPEPPRQGHSLRVLLLGAGGVLLGGLLLQAGVSGRAAVPTLVGPPIALYSAIPLVGRLLPRRVAVTVPCLLALAWGVLAFTLVPESFAGAEIPVFVIEGVILVGSAVAVLTTNTDAIGRATERVGSLGGGLATRLGLAYPLARRFRTGLLLGMFALVIFTLTFLATLSNIFQSEGPRLATAQRGGFDLVVDSSRSNPVPTAELAAAPEVAAVAPLRTAGVQFRTWYIDEDRWWSLTGFDRTLLDGGPPDLVRRFEHYATDEEAWEAVLGFDPAALPGAPRPAVIADFFLQEGNGPPGPGLRVGDTFEMVDPVSGTRETLLVAGIREGDFAMNGVLLPASHVQAFAADSSISRHYVRVAPAAEVDEAASRLNGRFLTHGADARSFDRLTAGFLAQQTGFFRLIEGFLGLGLVIGIAGLGVVMVRAVRERRRQIGMLRAMGFAASTVRRAFVAEAAFIALQGIVVGIGLALLTSYSVLTNSGAFGDQALPFKVPWTALLVVFAVPLGASLLAAAGPAQAASRIRPAVALRVAD